VPAAPEKDVSSVPDRGGYRIVGFTASEPLFQDPRRHDSVA